MMPKLSILCGMARHARVHSVATFQNIVAHDFNNELGVIIAECDLLETTLAEEETAALSRVKAIKLSASRLAKMLSASGSPLSAPTTTRR